MAKKKVADPMQVRLDAIHETLKDLLILTCARAGLTMGQARAVTGLDNNRVSSIWKHVKRTEK
jgi:hypothetical protein